jgi:hypothetical protein
MKHGLGAALALAGALAIGGCASAVTTATTVQDEVVAVCADAVPLASLDPAIGVYVTAACASEEAIAKVALSPTGLAWLERLYAELQTAKASVGAKP